MIVIADASCLILFTNIGRLDILASLYGNVVITSSVETEYGLDLPEFVSVQDPQSAGQIRTLSLMLDPGEASSIALALETRDSLILIDEKKGRRIAISLGLNVSGTLGVLLKAADKGLITPDIQLLNSLDECGFRLSNRLKDRLRGYK